MEINLNGLRLTSKDQPHVDLSQVFELLPYDLLYSDDIKTTVYRSSYKGAVGEITVHCRIIDKALYCRLITSHVTPELSSQIGTQLKLKFPGNEMQKLVDATANHIRSNIAVFCAQVNSNG